MPQLKGNMQKKCWKGEHCLRLSFPNVKEESKWFSFVFKMLGPSQTKGSGAVFKVCCSGWQSWHKVPALPFPALSFLLSLSVPVNLASDPS